MNKLDLKNMDFWPPRKWLAVPKNGNRPFAFTLEDVNMSFTAATEIYNNDTDSAANSWYDLDELYPPYGFTGYCDSKGEEVYGGQLVEGKDKIGSRFIGVIVWKDYGWSVESYVKGGLISWPLWELDGGWSCRLKNIGHIHQPDQWPEEVRRLLE